MGIVLFYSLPVEDIEEGMSTEDGQDVLSVDATSDPVFVTVYTPRSDDADADDQNRLESETRTYRRGLLVGMGVFPDTAVDGYDHPNAVRKA